MRNALLCRLAPSFVSPGATGAAILLTLCGHAAGQLVEPPALDEGIAAVVPELAPRPVRLVIPEAPRIATLHTTGQQVAVDIRSVWKPICGTTPGAVTQADLADMAAFHSQTMAAPGVTIVDRQAAGYNQRGAGINIVYVLGANVPAAAVPAFAAAEAYIEAQFSDPITLTVSVSFASLGQGILGGTSSTYGFATYANSRAGLDAGRDADDTIQAFLPTGATLPVRYNGRKSTVTNEDRVFWTLGNFNAAVGAVAGNGANMQYSTNFPFDFDPSNGVSGSAYSFQDVVIHETGHAMGFTSGADFRSGDLEALDLFRFQSTDGSGNSDYNPDTTAEFQVRARLVSYNSPADAVNSDIISSEFRMSDGFPDQASHFREQSPNIGLMDPQIGAGQTRYPAFFSTADLTMFDAIGYDR